jgi:hypothetical protein
VSIGQTMRRFQGEGHLGGIKDYKNSKEWSQKVSYKGNYFDYRLSDGLASKVIEAFYLLPISKLLLKAYLSISDNWDFTLGLVDL